MPYRLTLTQTGMVSAHSGIISIISIPDGFQIPGEREAPNIWAAVAGQWPEPMSATVYIIQVVKFCPTWWYTARGSYVLPLTTTCTPIILPLRRQSWLPWGPVSLLNQHPSMWVRVLTVTYFHQHLLRQPLSAISAGRHLPTPNICISCKRGSLSPSTMPEP